MIELVVFDMAGTTVFDGDAVNASFRAALAAHGVTADPAVVDRVMGYHKPEAIRVILETVGRPAGPAEVDAVHTAFVARMCDYYATDPAVREIPGAAAAFARPRSTSSLVMVASTTPGPVQPRRASTASAMRRPKPVSSATFTPAARSRANAAAAPGISRTAGSVA